MNTNKNFFDALYALDNITLYKYALAYLIGIFGFLASLQVFFIFLEKKITQKMVVNNEKRLKINTLLAKKKDAEHLKTLANEELTKDTTFRIKDYVLSVMQKTGFQKKILSGGDSVVEQPSKPGYIELSTSFELGSLGLEEVAVILHTCDSDPRVYFKEIEIKNNVANKTLTIAFVIATTQIVT